MRKFFQKEFDLIDLVIAIVFFIIIIIFTIFKIFEPSYKDKINKEIIALQTQIKNAKKRYAMLGNRAGKERKVKNNQRAYFHTNCFWVQLAQYKTPQWYISIAPVDVFSGPGYNKVELNKTKCHKKAFVREKIYFKAKSLGLIKKIDGWSNIKLLGNLN